MVNRGVSGPPGEQTHWVPRGGRGERSVLRPLRRRGWLKQVWGGEGAQKTARPWHPYGCAPLPCTTRVPRAAWSSSPQLLPGHPIPAACFTRPLSPSLSPSLSPLLSSPSSSAFHEFSLLPSLHLGLWFRRPPSSVFCIQTF